MLSLNSPCIATCAQISGVTTAIVLGCERGVNESSSARMSGIIRVSTLCPRRPSRRQPVRQRSRAQLVQARARTFSFPPARFSSSAVGVQSSSNSPASSSCRIRRRYSPDQTAPTRTRHRVAAMTRSLINDRPISARNRPAHPMTTLGAQSGTAEAARTMTLARSLPCTPGRRREFQT